MVVTNLRKFTTYMVSVEGFTSKGSGIESKCVKITTAEDSKIWMCLFMICDDFSVLPGPEKKTLNSSLPLTTFSNFACPG